MEKITLNYSASGQKLKPLYSLKKFASDTVNYVVAVFDLDESWAFDSVRAVWKTENVCISTVLDQDGACTVPQEVLQKKAKVEVNLVGSDVEENQLTERLTTYPVQAFIVDRDVPICGSETAEITPSQFEQFVQLVTAEVAKIRDVDRVELNDDYTITFYYSDGTESPKIGPIRGETGADGNGIQNITKIGSEGRIDTYRIIYTNGEHFDFNVTNGEKGDRGEQGETGNGIDRIEKTGTVGSVDTYTIYFTDGTTTTFDVTDGEVTNAVLDEATIVQTNTDNVPYLFRPSGGDVRTGRKEFDTIVGGTVAWNQLVGESATSVTVQSGHKYIAKIGGAWSVAASSGSAISVTGGTDMLIDLTALFNPTIANYIYSLEQSQAGAGVAWFRKLFPKDYYPYDAGSLQSVEGVSAHETVGFNQWDEEWEVGSISRATGQNENVTGQMRSKNYIRVLPNTQYYLLCTSNTSGASIAWICYDENKNFISSQWIRTSLFTTPLDCHYIRFTSNTAYGATYNNDICINLSDPSRNGEYEPYVKHSYPLDNSLTLRGIPKLDASNNLYYDGDTYASDGTVTRAFSDEYVIQASDIYQVDDTYENVIYARMQIKTGWMNSNSKQAINSKFGVGESVYPFDDAKAIGKMAINAGTNNYFFGFAKGTTLEQMKNALAGTTMVAKLATPTTETAEPYTNPQIVDPSGTEEYVGSPIPVGHETDYPMTLTDTMPTANGTYTLNLTVANGKRSVSWTNELAVAIAAL